MRVAVRCRKESATAPSIAPDPAREGWRVRRRVHRAWRLMGYLSCLPGSFLRADTHIARFPARIQSLSGLLSSRVLRLAKRATRRAYRIDLRWRLQNAPTNEERNGESSSYRHRHEGGLSADDQNHPPIPADQILRSHSLLRFSPEMSGASRDFKNTGKLAVSPHYGQFRRRGGFETGR